MNKGSKPATISWSGLVEPEFYGKLDWIFIKPEFTELFVSEPNLREFTDAAKAKGLRGTIVMVHVFRAVPHRSGKNESIRIRDIWGQMKKSPLWKMSGIQIHEVVGALKTDPKGRIVPTLVTDPDVKVRLNTGYPAVLVVTSN